MRPPGVCRQPRGPGSAVSPRRPRRSVLTSGMSSPSVPSPNAPRSPIGARSSLRPGTIAARPAPGVEPAAPLEARGPREGRALLWGQLQPPAGLPARSAVSGQRHRDPYRQMGSPYAPTGSASRPSRPIATRARSALAFGGIRGAPPTSSGTRVAPAAPVTVLLVSSSGAAPAGAGSGPVGDRAPSGRYLLIGAVAGAFNVAALAAFYRGLAVGTMGHRRPRSSQPTPWSRLAFGQLTGERLVGLRAFNRSGSMGVVLVSRTPAEGGDRPRKAPCLRAGPGRASALCFGYVVAPTAPPREAIRSGQCLQPPDQCRAGGPPAAALAVCPRARTKAWHYGSR